MRISFDLDEVIFTLEPLFRQANNEFGRPYHGHDHWDVVKCFGPEIGERICQLFRSDILYQMPLVSAEYPTILNTIINDKRFETFFVTQRALQQPEKSYQQLRNAGITCAFDQLYDKSMPKVEVLKQLNTDLHFDDSPYVVGDCLRNNVNIVMISNNRTKYNHFLRDRVQHYPDLKTALCETGIYTR